MSQILIRIALVLASSWLATWLRMLDKTLFMQSWQELWGKHVVTIVLAAMFSPLLELFHCWPGYLLGFLIFMAVTELGLPGTMSRHQSIFLGLAAGAASYLVIATLTAEWIMRPVGHNTKLLGIYAVAGAFHGWSYYRFLIQHRPIERA